MNFILFLCQWICLGLGLGGLYRAKLASSTSSGAVAGICGSELYLLFAQFCPPDFPLA